MKTIKDYPHYKIGEDGSVVSYKREKPTLLKPQLVTQSRKKYLAVGLYNKHNKKNKNGLPVPTMKYLHRLVWETYMGEIPDGLQIDHIDENPHNCSLENLRLITHTQNTITYHRNKKGFLYSEKREEVIQDYLKIQNYELVAKKWNCSKSTIYRVIKNKRNSFVGGKTVLVDGWDAINDVFTSKDMRGTGIREDLGMSSINNPPNINPNNE